MVSDPFPIRQSNEWPRKKELPRREQSVIEIGIIAIQSYSKEGSMSNIRIQSAVSEEGRRIVGRLLPGTDLIKGIEKMCHLHNVVNGNVVSVIGSLSEAKIVYAVSDETGKIGIRYSAPVSLEGPLELLAAQGVIGRTVDDEIGVHLHGLMSTPEMTVYGGHFLENGNPILATAEILIQESNDVRMIREQDEETGFPLFKFYSN